MTAAGLTIADVERLHPCPPALPRIRAALLGFNADPDHRFTAAEARAAGCTIWDLIWVAAKVAAVDEQVRRRFSHCLADFATRVLPVFEKRFPSDNRPRAAIDAVRTAAETGASAELALTAAHRAHAAARAARRAVDAAFAARATARATATAATFRASAVIVTEADLAAHAACVAADNPRAERAWQFDRLVAWLSDDPPEPLPLPPSPRAVIQRAAAPAHVAMVPQEAAATAKLAKKVARIGRKAKGGVR